MRDESDLFFGRDDCVNIMVDRLAARRFLAVLGPSGSGKSSLVRTGLLDALDLGLHPKASLGWKVAELHPGGRPMRELATSLLQTLADTSPDEEKLQVLTTFLSQGPRSLQEWISYGNLPSGTNLLLLVDQFEELFRYGDYAQREETEAFVGLLLESAGSPAGAIHVLITMRSEYLGACASIPGLAERISSGLYLTPRMSREECRQAIEGPASVLGFTVEPALVNRLLNDLASFAPWEGPEDLDLATLLSHQADQLPLMQHVLNRLWVRAESGADGAPVILKLADYDQLGGLSGALDEHGEELVASLGPSRMRAIENVFRALVSGTSLATAVRRPCRMKELVGLVESAGGSRDDAAAVVDAFRAPDCSFLRTTSATLANDNVIVDLSHESLIRQWTPLREWLEKEVRDGLAWRRLILAEEHYSHHEGGLLGGLDLSNLTAWWQSAGPTPAWAARHGGKFETTQAFVDASRLAETERADAEHRRQMQRRNLLLAVIASLAVALAMAGWSVWQRGVAHRNEVAKNQLLTINNAQLTREREAADELVKVRDEAVKAKKKQVELLSTALEANRKANAATKARVSAENATAQALSNAAVALSNAALLEQRANEKEEESARFRKMLVDRGVDVSEVTQSKAFRSGSVASPPNEQLPMPEPSTNAEAGHAEVQRAIVSPTSTPQERNQSVMMTCNAASASKVSGRAQSNEGSEEYGRAVAADEDGDAVQALKMFSKAYCDYVGMTESRPAGKGLDAALDASFIQDAYFYDWFLFDFRQYDEGDQVLQRLERVASQYDPATAPAPILLAMAKIENLKSRRAYDHQRSNEEIQYLRDAIGLASRSFIADPTLETMRFLFRFYENYSAKSAVPDAEKEDFKKKACVLADQMFNKDPAYRYSIRARVECLRDESDRAIAKKDLDEADIKLRAAREVVQNSLQLRPNNQDLLLFMTAIEGDMASLWSLRTGKNAKTENEHKLSAKSYFVKALTDRTRLQGNPTEIRDLYQNFKSIEFSRAEEGLGFYRDIANAVEKSVQEFPEVPSFAYVLADASNSLAQLEVKEHRPNADDAERFLSTAIASFNRSGALDSGSSYSEDFYVFCGVYRNRAELYAATDRVDLMLGDIVKMMDSCNPVLDKYPWDVYLRFHFLDSAEFAGKKLMDLHRYGDARRHLEYASHWGVGTSSKLLGSMYGEGLGVPKDEEKAKQLNDLAKGQTIKRFTIAADFGGVKAPFNFYVRAWPTEYVSQFPGIDDQVKWLQEARGGTVAAEVVDAFRNLQKIAKDNKVSFPELCAYALNKNKDGKDQVDGAKEVRAARKKYSGDANVENLESLRVAVNAQYTELVKVKKQSAADALQEELAEDAEKLIRKEPGPEVYRVTWEILTDQGDRFKPTNPHGALKAFTRSAELADLLPEDNASDQYKRLFSYERLGTLYFADGKFEHARECYTRGVEAARKRYTLKATAGNLKSLRIVTIDLYAALVKLKSQAEADVLPGSLLAPAESLLAHSQSGADLREVALVYVDVASQLFASGDLPQAQKNLTRGQELAGKLANDTPDGAYGRYQLFDTIADLLFKNETTPDDARAAYLQASLSLENYVQFRTASPPSQAAEDRGELFEIYGSLSWVSVLAGNFDKSIEAAHAGLKLKPDAAYIEANLAHGLLLTGKPDEAIEHYMKVRKGMVGDRRILDATAEDFSMLKRLGYGDAKVMDSILKRMGQE